MVVWCMFGWCSQETAKVTATVIEHGRSAKVVVFKKKRRKNYKRKRGRYISSKLNYRVNTGE